MSRLAWELIVSIAAVVAIGAWYATVASAGAPAPSSLVGHGLGIVGFLMMLAAETLYTLRKRLRGFHWGRMSLWLQAHVVTGIVGPFLVLLHTAGKFNGLAGVVTFLTLLMVASGFVGRYIYTAAPRTLDGAEVEVQVIQERILRAEQELRRFQAELGPAAQVLPTEAPRPGFKTVLGRGILQWQQKRRVHQAITELHLAESSQAAALERLLVERYRLLVQVNSLALTRRLLALWHLFHIPLGAMLFSLAFLHIGAALYYATFLK